MLQIIKQVLSADALIEFRDILSQSNFVDGRHTAGKNAQSVKHNLELDPNTPKRDMLNKAALGTVMSNHDVQHGMMPLKVSTPIFAKYTKDMSYGYHVDNPMMGVPPDVYRSDVSLTLFLNDPADYDGGELSIRSDFGEQLVKLDAGDMVAYPSSSLHQVKPVLAGERLVMVAWVQSQIRDPARREILFNLWQVQSSLTTGDMTDEVMSRFHCSFANLWRMWSDT